ncbi:MAG: cytochrome c oxidase subunit II [Acidimicrobiales bacterium]
MKNMPTPITEQAKAMAGLWTTFASIAIGVFALVIALLVFTVIRFRRREEGLPDQTSYRVRLELTYTMVPLFLVTGLFVATVRTVEAVDASIASPDLVVDVVGFQWQWRFTYPDSGVVVQGEPGMAPELVLPEGASVRFNLESNDVIHSFWIPGFLFKRDVIPGSPTSFDVNVSGAPGLYPGGACAEFCGLYHDQMTFSVTILDRPGFDRWLESSAQDQGAVRP